VTGRSSNTTGIITPLRRADLEIKRRAPEISDARFFSHVANHFARRQKPTSMLFALCSPGKLLTIVRSQTSSRTT
jgi:hypothetical protein